MKNRILIFVTVFLMLFAGIIGCTSNKYNAEIYSSANEFIQESFLEENKVKGAYYKNPDYNGDDEAAEKYYYDEDSPGSRTFIIKDEQTFNEIFSENSPNIDLNKKTVLLYIFADIYPSRSYTISKITLNEKILTVYIKLEKRNKADATMPYQRCVVVTIGKTDIDDAIFVEQYK